jgi:UDP-glucose 4-epimerase
VAATRGDGAALRLPGISLARLELLSEPADWQTAMQSCLCVVHLAARVHELRAGAQIQSEYDRINVDGSRFVAEQALQANVQKLVFLSSIKVNGEGGGRPYEIGDLPDPKDAYGRSKWVAEQSLRDVCAKRGMGLVIIRPPLVYGPGVKANFHRLMRLAGLGMPLPIASIANRRSFIGVSNLVDFIETCLTHSGASADAWLVSDGEDLSTPDLLSRLSTLMGRPLRMFGIPPVWLRRLARPLALSGTVERLSGTLQVDSSAARQRLAWEPPLTVDEELARTVAAYRAERTK